MNFDRLGETSESDAMIDETAMEGDVADEFGLGGGGTSRRRVGEGTIVIIGALLIAAGALYGMRWLGSQSGSRVGDATLEARVIAFLEGIAGKSGGVAGHDGQAVDPKEIMDRLADDRTAKQVPLAEVKMNPFLRKEDTSDLVGPTEVQEIDPAELERQRRERRYAEIELAANTLMVTSIIGREGNRVAVVEGEVVRVGDQLKIDENTTFDVKRIETFDVFLECDGFPFIVSMDR